MRGTALAALLCVASLTTPVFGQVTAVLEGGGSRIDYAGSPDLSALSVSPGLQWLTPSSRLTVEGGFAQFSGGGWSLQGAAAASGFTPAFGLLRGELAGTAIGSTSGDGADAGELLAHARLHVLGRREGIWLGGALGRAWNGLTWRSDVRGDAGAWLRRDALTLTATAAPAWVGDSLRFVDANLAARLAGGAVEVTASGGARWWSRPVGAAGSGWGSASAAVWLGPHFALVAAGGSYPVDYAQGLPAGRYVSLGVRLASRRPGLADDLEHDAALTRVGRPGAGRPGPRLPSPVVASFEIQSSGEDRQRVRLEAPGAHSVELIGDFTGWRALPLQRAADGSWQTTLTLAPGLYRMNLRVDGGVWGVPPGLPAITDDFGGVVGILRIAHL